MFGGRVFAVCAAIELEPVGVFEDLLADQRLGCRVGVETGDDAGWIPGEQHTAHIEDDVPDIHVRSMAG